MALLDTPGKKWAAGILGAATIAGGTVGVSKLANGSDNSPPPGPTTRAPAETALSGQVEHEVKGLRRRLEILFPDSPGVADRCLRELTDAHPVRHGTFDGGEGMEFPVIRVIDATRTERFFNCFGEELKAEKVGDEIVMTDPKTGTKGVLNTKFGLEIEGVTSHGTTIAIEIAIKMRSKEEVQNLKNAAENAAGKVSNLEKELEELKKERENLKRQLAAAESRAQKARRNAEKARAEGGNWQKTKEQLEKAEEAVKKLKKQVENHELRLQQSERPGAEPPAEEPPPQEPPVRPAPPPAERPPAEEPPVNPSSTKGTSYLAKAQKAIKNPTLAGTNTAGADTDTARAGARKKILAIYQLSGGEKFE